MAKNTMRPLAALVPGARGFFSDVVTPAVYGAAANQGDQGRVLGAFILMHSMRDWAKEEQNLPSDYYEACPYASLIAEIATASKHAKVSDGQMTDDPHCLEFRIVGFGEGVYGAGAYGRSLQARGRRHTSDPVEWHGLSTILKDAALWWEKQLVAHA